MPLKDYLQFYGYSDRELPLVAGQYRGQQLIVCGDAACVWDDLARLDAKCEAHEGSVRKHGWDIMTVNKIVEVMPGIVTHAYSNDPRLLSAFIAARRQEYVLTFGPPLYTHSCNDGAMYKWPFGGHGTSGLGAALVGVALGYSEVVLCGIPLDDGPHNGEPPWRRTGFTCEAAGDIVTGEEGHWKNARLMAFEGKVKSMSGRTREWLGEPR